MKPPSGAIVSKDERIDLTQFEGLTTPWDFHAKYLHMESAKVAVNLIAELKRCYEEIDALQGKIDDAHEAMEKYSNEEIDNVCDAYEEVCMALD